MPRKRRGAIASVSGVQSALRRIEEIDAALETLTARLAKTKLAQQIDVLEEEKHALSIEVDAFVLDHYEAGDGYEDDAIRITKVQGHSRRWNAETLMRLVPRGVFKTLVDVTVVPAKVDDAVKAGRITLEQIADAFEETPNRPYLKRTVKAQGREDQAASLAEKLS